ncbi:MAG: ATP-grasp domain-containing protein [Bacteroidia bacterium]
MIPASPVLILRKLFQRDSYSKLKSLIINQSFYTKEKFLFPHSKLSEYSILLTDKDAHRNNITQEHFKKLGIKVEFKRFDDSIDFKKYNLVVPITIDDLQVCSSNREAINQQHIPIPSAEAIHICNQKGLMITTLRNAGLGRYVPGETTGFPYILKNDYGEYSATTYIVRDAEDEARYASFINNPNYLKQQLITGNEEFATHVIIKGGKIVTSLTVRYKYPEAVYLQGNTKQVSRHVVKCRHTEIFTHVLNIIGYEGLCCIDYKVQDGVPKIFEINPRFGGSLSPYFFSMLRHLN